MKRTWKIDEAANDERLDVFLSHELELTRSQIVKRLKSGAATVNGKPVTPHHFLKTGNTVVFDDAPRETAKPKHATQIVQPTSTVAPHFKLIDETPDYLVIDKPSGVIVHPDAKQTTGTLVDALIEHDPKIAKVGEDPSRPGIVHRLDREVSGLMVIAKTQAAYDSLKKQFAEHSVEKRYIALVFGEVRQDEGDLKFRIARSTTKGRMAARPEGEETGKAAWTHYKTLKRFKHASLLELTILSGRTHQIRAHLLAFSHPVIGDTLYVRKSENRNLTAPRLMLQSVWLEFNDPSTGERKTYTLKPAPEFAFVEKMLM